MSSENGEMVRFGHINCWEKNVCFLDFFVFFWWWQVGFFDFSDIFYTGKLESQVIRMTGTQPTGTQLEWVDSRPRFLLWFSHRQLRNKIFDLPMLQAMVFSWKGQWRKPKEKPWLRIWIQSSICESRFLAQAQVPPNPPRIDNTILYTRRWRQRPSQKADYGGVLSTMYQLDGWGVPQYEKDTAMGQQTQFFASWLRPCCLTSSPRFLRGHPGFRNQNPYISANGLGWWFGILGIPLSNNPFHKGILGIQTTNSALVEYWV